MTKIGPHFIGALLAGIALPLAVAAQDTWAPMTTTGAPTARSGQSAVWTGSHMIVWGGQGSTGGSETNTGGRYDPVADTWAATSTAGAPSARMLHTAVWTGSRMIVWGGNIGGGGTLTNTGASYDPISNTWAPISAAGAPAARQNHIAVWTGREMLVWGGDDNAATFYGDGARYDPVSNTWTPITLTGAPVGRDSGLSAVWTGRELILWGGRNGAGTVLATGSRYDPELNQWTAVGLAGSNGPRAFHAAVWTGREMIVWGGTDGTVSLLGTGGRYDPQSDSWTPMFTPLGSSGKVFSNAVWTGRYMITWGGSIAGGVPGIFGGIYDPVLDTWMPMDPTGGVDAARYQSCVWSGREMIVWGGLTNANVATNPINVGSRFLPSAWPIDSWSTIPTTGAPSARSGQSAVWSGREMLVWGGSITFGTSAGGNYDPISESWTAISTGNAPSDRVAQTAVWTDREMIVWGGFDGGPGTSSGGRYDPRTDTWIATSLVGAPSPRQNHTAVWTGREMIIWGGSLILSSGFSTNTGARYDPRSNTWTPVTTTGAPSARGWHSAVWTGREMIVWGGGSYAGGPTTYLNTGARYDPRTDTWTPMTTTGAAGARLGHKAVWTGDQIILWGGVGATGYVATGGRYSPAQDAWISMATPAALSGRELHSAVWTGREMIIWGGTASSYENTGGRYSLDINNWTSTTLTGAPDGRHSHSAVWTGSRMLVWGGTTNTGPTTNTGGAYGGDDSPPIAGVIRDGNNPPDLILQLDRTSISANWSGFSDPESGIVRYEWAIGTSPGATDVMPFRDTGTIGGTVYGLSLSVGTTYYVTARFTNGDRRTTTASSNGVYIGNDLTASSGCSASVSGAGMLPLGTGLVALILLLAAKPRVRE